MIRSPKRFYVFATITQVFGGRISGVLLSLLLLASASKVFAHAGHGDEFHQSEAAQSADAIEVDEATAERIGLKVEPVTRQSLAFGVQATGQIETSPNRRVEVTNPVGGTVVRLLVEPGETVEAGQSLVVITSGELAELRVVALENSAERQGDIQQAQADLRLAQQNYDRQQQIAQIAIEQAQTEIRVAQEQFDRDRELMQQGAIGRREFLESEAHLAEAKKALTEAESRLSLLEAGNQLERAQTALEVAQNRAELSTVNYSTRLQQLGADANSDGTITIKAPISGQVSDREVSLGQSAEDAGTSLMTIVDDRTVLATANIFEKDLNQVSVGQRVRVTVSGLPEQVFEGRIATVGAVVAADGRVVPVKAELENLDGSLKPGMFAELEILTQRTPEPVLVIPQSAIIEANGQQIVFVQNGDNFEPVEVTPGRMARNLVEIESGLFDGDRIVTQRANQLYAQSLRGKPAEPEETDATTEPTLENPLPRWVMAVGGGAIIAGIFAAGVWAGRRRGRFPAPNQVNSQSNSYATLHHSNHESEIYRNKAEPTTSVLLTKPVEDHESPHQPH